MTPGGAASSPGYHGTPRWAAHDRRGERPMISLTSVSMIQGAYFLVAGVWPLLSIRTFEAVTGPKTDDWLVKTVGVLVAVIGLVLFLAGLRGEIAPEVAILAVGSSLALAGIDVWYVARRVISRVYLLDAALELVLVAAWVIGGVVDGGVR